MQLSVITQIDGLVYEAFEGQAVRHGWREMGWTSEIPFPQAVEIPGMGMGMCRFGRT